MSRQALLVGMMVSGETVLDETLPRYGYSRIWRTETLAQAIDLHGQEPIDLLVLPMDEVDDAGLAAIDRAEWAKHGVRMIATGATADPTLMLRAMRAGIQEFLVRPIAMTDCVAAVERLHKRVDRGDATGQVFAVYSAKGGLGVSTIAVNLACGIATLHPSSRVAVADLGIPGGDTSLLLNVRPTYSIGDVAGRVEHLDDELLNSVMTPAGNGLWVLAASERPEASDEVDAAVISTVLARLRANFAFSVIDCEHQVNDRTLAALDAANRVVLVTELQVPAIRSTQRTLGVFRRLGYPAEKLAVVVNRHGSGDVLSVAEAADVLKEDVFSTIPNDYKIVSDAGTAGVPVEIKNASSRLAVAYRQLAQRLAGGTLPESIGAPGKNGRSGGIRQLFARKRS